jgi:predicted TIM-barrel fold metal-dependent hydrolase
VHPGPAAGSPAWFPALTAYVAEMSTAWHAWAEWGRPAHPTLTVVFAMLAGLAPLHAERLAARGGPSYAVHDPLTFFDTSSYGPRAIDAMLRVVGVDRLLYGTDRPVVEPVPLELGAAAEHALTVANPERVL